MSLNETQFIYAVLGTALCVGADAMNPPDSKDALVTGVRERAAEIMAAYPANGWPTRIPSSQGDDDPFSSQKKRLLEQTLELE